MKSQIKSKIQDYIIRIALISVICILLSASGFFSNQNRFNALPNHISNQSDQREKELSPCIQIPSYADSNLQNLTGTGQSLNVTHFANRTDSNLDQSFTNGSNSIYNMPIGNSWQGKQLNVSLTNLTDTRNWINGSFAFGNDGHSYGQTEDDTNLIANPYFNWTFYTSPGHTENMAGNYYNSSSSAGRNALEMLMAGTYAKQLTTWYYWYNANDYCQWSANFQVPRGAIRDAIISFQVNPEHLCNFTSWELQILLDNQLVSTFGSYALKSLGDQQWQTINVPMALWINSTNVYSAFLNTTQHNIIFRWINYPPGYIGYEDFYPNTNYQQIWIANPQFIIKSDVKAEQLGLLVNNQTLSSSTFGIASSVLNGNWSNDYLPVTFNATNNASYSVDFLTTLNLFAQSNGPSTDYEANTASYGVSYSISNASMNNWLWYAYFNVPLGYSEYNFNLYYPGDWQITWVSSPQLPGTNQISLCNTTIKGIISIPINTISATPNGFWKFEATSSNYLLSISTFKNSTASPGPNDWSLSSSVFAGDYLNITANLNNTANFTNFGLTNAQLNIEFPNGTLWISQGQNVVVESGGIIEFDPIQIPSMGPDYQVGSYLISVSWNNTISATGSNETGLSSTSVIVKHYSELIINNNYLSDVLENTTAPLRIMFQDQVSGDPIETANLSFSNLIGSIQEMSEIAPGFYYTEVFAPSNKSGNNNLQIQATQPYYATTSINVTIEIVLGTTLQLTEYPSISVPWNSNFILHLNYTQFSNGTGISNGNISVNWMDNFTVNNTGNGLYTINCSNSLTQGNQLYLLTISVNDYSYQPNSITTDIQVVPRDTFLNVWFNSLNATATPSMEVPITTMVNFTCSYYDSQSMQILTNATYSTTDLDSSWYIFSQINSNFQFLFDTGKMGLGIHIFTITLTQGNYKPITQTLQIKVDQIQTNIVTHDTNQSYSIEVGNSFQFSIKLVDQDFGGLISGANVTYNWRYGSGSLIENTTSHEYSTNLTNIPEGTYVIYIFVSKGSQYNFQQFQITLAVLPLPPTTGTPVWEIYIFIAVILGIGIFFVAYQKIWRYPKTVRQIRSFKSQLKSKKIKEFPMKNVNSVFIENYLSQNKEDIAKIHQMALKNQPLPEKKPTNISPNDQKPQPSSNIQKQPTLKSEETSKSINESPENDLTNIEPVTNVTEAKIEPDNTSVDNEIMKSLAAPAVKLFKPPSAPLPDSTIMKKELGAKPKIKQLPPTPKKDE